VVCFPPLSALSHPPSFGRSNTVVFHPGRVHLAEDMPYALRPKTFQATVTLLLSRGTRPISPTHLPIQVAYFRSSTVGPSDLSCLPDPPLRALLLSPSSLILAELLQRLLPGCPLRPFLLFMCKPPVTPPGFEQLVYIISRDDLRCWLASVLVS